MTNQQLIKTTYVWALTAFLAGGLWVVAAKSGALQQQNSNQNGNSNGNSNSNSNTDNSNRAQNQNANRATNRNTATGGQSGMGNLSSRDRNFLMDAAMGGMMEVELGRIAAQQGTSEAVKQFGQRMVDDHSKANAELMSLASSKGITLPTALDAKHQAHVTKLSSLTGAEFDRAYAKQMVNDHSKKADAFEKQSTRGTDPDLKAFASKTLPTIQEHLQMARALDPGRGGNSNSGGARNSNSNGNSNRNSNSNNNNRP